MCNKMLIIVIVLLLTSNFRIHAQEEESVLVPAPEYKFSVSTPWLTFSNFGKERTNIHHYEFHVKYDLTSKDKIGLKIATWKLYAPMGIPLWDPHVMKESEYYPGRVRELGFGFSYQRIIWKGVFAAIEILPQLKTYLDEYSEEIAYGFKLYTSYHLGYHLPIFKKTFNHRLFIEPQIHCQYWPIDTNTPESFKEVDKRWNNYFLFEPNIYIGIKF